jgi:arylformamidase
MRLIDVSHTLESGMVTYKGLPAPVVCDYLSREASRRLYASGTEFQIGCIDMVGNTGTYLDSPFHRYVEGKDLSQLPLAAADIRGKAVLIPTDWDVHWRTEQYFEGFPYLNAGLACWSRDAGAVLVGIDSHNIDCTDGGERPVHSTLLGADVPIVEHLCGFRGRRGLTSRRSSRL